MEPELIKVGLLVAPSGFWLMTLCERSSICNGCGPYGNVFFDFLSIIMRLAIFTIIAVVSVWILNPVTTYSWTTCRR